VLLRFPSSNFYANDLGADRHFNRPARPDLLLLVTTSEDDFNDFVRARCLLGILFIGCLLRFIRPFDVQDPEHLSLDDEELLLEQVFMAHLLK